jgi:hypothetical protein
MNLQTNEWARSAQGESLCGSCSQPWFGSVAYCPYCGKPSFASTNRQPDAPHGEKAAASGQGNLGIPAGELPPREDEPSHKESRRKPLPGLPIFGRNSSAGRDRAVPSQMSRRAMALLFTVAAGVGALFFWMLVKLPAPRTEAGAPPQPPISTPGTAFPTQGPPTSAAQVPPVSARTDTAGPPPSLPRSAETAVPRQSNRSALCSSANEAAGLCKSQQ